MSRKGIQLAYPFEEKRLAKWQPPYIVQPKYDGERCRAVPIGEGKYMLLSSQENPFFSVPHIVDDLWGLRDNVELDGELYCHGMDFEQIHSIVSRTVNLHPDHKEIRYHVFDYMSEEPQRTRMCNLCNLVSSEWSRPVVRAPFHICDSLEDIMRAYDRLLSEGYEGIIVRHLHAPYVRKRSIYMMKFKPKKDDHYTIKGYSIEVDIQGSIKEGKLGRIICAGAENPDAKVLGEYPPHTKLPDGYFGVGSGMTDGQRENLWIVRHVLPNKTCHVQYQHITSGKGVPRFPVFLEVIEGEPTT